MLDTGREHFAAFDQLFIISVRLSCLTLKRMFSLSDTGVRPFGKKFTAPQRVVTPCWSLKEHHLWLDLFPCLQGMWGGLPCTAVLQS
jgi:hypothetical protein